MKILAFDSTAKVASVAVCDNDSLLSQYTVDNGLTQSELLLPMAEDMLRELKLDFSDIELFAASVGPGSFTGVRIGAALIKGLAFGKGTPCSEVSTLEALAYNLNGMNGIIVPAMDARRGQVYTALFRAEGGVLTRLMPDSALSIEELDSILAAYGEPVSFAGDGYSITVEALTKTEYVSTPERLRYQSAASVAAVAYRKYLAGETVSDREMKVTYLRPSQAERTYLEKQNAKKDSL